MGITSRESEFSIVVLGAMNPCIHHPYWYRTIGAISEEEEAQAISSPEMVCVPVFARLSIGSLTIACQQDRWQILTSQPSSRTRMLEIAKLVFLKLYETPVSVFGLNTKSDIETKVTNVAGCLAKAVGGSGIGLGASGGQKQSCSINFQEHFATHLSRIEVRPSELSDDCVFVGQNTEYKASSKEGSRYVDLHKLFEQHFEPDFQAAQELFDRVVNSLNQLCEKNDGNQL